MITSLLNCRVKRDGKGNEVNFGRVLCDVPKIFRGSTRITIENAIKISLPF